MSEVLELLDRNARFYEAEAGALKPTGARHLGPSEAAEIATIMRRAKSEIEKLVGEVSYLTDEVIPVLKQEAEKEKVA